MSFSHTNKVTFQYTAGGVTTTTNVSKTETSGAEINLSEAVTTDASVETTAIDIDHFQIDDASQAVSVYIRIDGFDCELKGGAAGAVTMITTLSDGEPYVWSFNGGTDFPTGNANPLEDSTDILKIVPKAGAGLETAGTLTVRVLYDPTIA